MGAKWTPTSLVDTAVAATAGRLFGGSVDERQSPAPENNQSVGKHLETLF